MNQDARPFCSNVIISEGVCHFRVASSIHIISTGRAVIRSVVEWSRKRMVRGKIDSFSILRGSGEWVSPRLLLIQGGGVKVQRIVKRFIGLSEARQVV